MSFLQQKIVYLKFIQSFLAHLDNLNYFKYEGMKLWNHLSAIPCNFEIVIDSYNWDYLNDFYEKASGWYLQWGGQLVS